MKTRPSRIITFYSYKGGTGRTMALANVAWVLASNGYRVLTIDWDLEAPGLHRYLHPFLIDPELTASPGLIDLVTAFVEAAVGPSDGEDERWYEPLADLHPYAVAVNWKFPAPGRLDFIPAGRQGPGYAARVNAFDWRHFYDELGGGAFLEKVKDRMRVEYDYILVDSRTGVSDTAGICTVQMPDALVVCFTASRQSVEGAAAVARSVREAWGELPDGSPARRIFPVLTRVELGEKERLGRAQDYARAVFAPFLDHLSPDSRAAYWDRVETLYYPFYAYEEVLAVFADRQGQSKSVLASVEQLTGYLTEGVVTALIPVAEEERVSVLVRMLRGEPTPVSPRTEIPTPERTYRAFVCSTFLDLHAQRALATKTLQDRAFNVSSKVDWAPESGDAINAARDEVQQCDLFILLVAYRRGFVPPGDTLSVTQQLYETARNREIDILVFLLDEDALWPPRFVQTASDPEIVQWRAELQKRHVVRLFASNDSLQLEIIRAVEAWLAQRQVKDRLPRQIPPSPTNFAGRSDELETLTGLLNGAIAPTMIAVTGLGGVGKTALALKLAERLAGLFPDGRIYLDMRGVSDKPVSWREAMGHVIRSYLPKDRLPEGEDELQALYRTLLRGKRALLLMDNAADIKQIEPLRPPQGCLVVVTSRRRGTLPGMEALDLDALPQADAEELLHAISPRIGAFASEIAALCGRLPLALRLAGSMLAERDDLPVNRYVDRLRTARLSQRSGLAEIAATLRLSEETLLADVRARWLELAVLVDGFETAWAQAVWNVDADTADDWLGTLLRNSLIEWDKQTQLYRMHDLVREFAVNALTAEAMQESQRLHARHFFAVLREANELFLKGGSGVVAAVQTFDRAWANVAAAHAWARQKGDEIESRRLCLEFPNAAVALLELRRPPHERIAWLEAALNAARSLGDRRGEGGALCNLGNAYAALGQPRGAIECHQQHLGIAREVGDRRGEGIAQGNVGSVFYTLGQPESAIECFQQQLTIAREIGDRRGEGNALGNLGSAYAALGQPRRAIEFYQQRLNIAREIGDRRGEGNALVNLGTAYYTLGQPHQAIEFYQQRLNITREIGDRQGEGNALGNLGNSYSALGQPQRAIDFYQQALNIAREIGDRRGEANLSWNHGLALVKLNRIAEAVPLMEIRVRFEQEIGHPYAEEAADRVKQMRTRLAGGT